MPRLVRRKPLRERVAAMLNPMDLLLWLSEEIETRDWDSQLVGTQLGLSLNFSLLLARANSALTTPIFNDDLFGDKGGSRWLYFMVSALSLTNAIYAFYRTRKYRLFQASVDTQPATPSARRVKVHSSPASSSPLRFLADMVTPQSAESRAHPDKDRDVWELAVWDPLPLSMRLLCFFSPGHVLVYWLFLPLAPLDPRPSMTVFNSLVMQVVLSVQMLLLCARFSQQAKDNNIIQKEVMREYDAKFVHPRLYPVVRDVGTQASEDEAVETPGLVQLGTPTTLLRRGFKTHGNPHVDSPDSPSFSGYLKPPMFTPPPASRRAEEAKHPDHKIRRHITSSCRRSSEGHGSDQILRWNTARDLPKSQPETSRPQVAGGPSSRHQAAFRKESHRTPRPKQAVEKHLVRTMEEKKEARRQRRTLKESGDYLGVQGINPATGQLDIMTPTDSDGSSEKQQKLNILQAALRDARQSYRNVKAQSEREARRILDSEARKLRRLEKEKQKLQNLSQRVRWQRQTKQWSSAQEPELSPIVGSRHGSSTRRPSKHQHPGVMEPFPVDLTAQGQRPREDETPDSTRTVVRTPQRQSLVTPSAWELFANGITFDNPDPAVGSFLGSGAEPGEVDTSEMMTSSGIPGPRQRDEGIETCTPREDPSVRPASRSTLRKLIAPLENLKSAKKNEAQLSADVVQPQNRECQQRGPTVETEAPAVEQPVGQTARQLLPLSSAQLVPQNIMDDEWMERALKDLADTGDRFTKEPAFTHITTTIGFDRVTSKLSQAEGVEEASYQQSRIIYNLSESSLLDDDSASSTAMKTTQNTSPSSTPAPSGEVTGTTSAVMKQAHSMSLKSTSSRQMMQQMMDSDDHDCGDGRDGSLEASQQKMMHQIGSSEAGLASTREQQPGAANQTTKEAHAQQANDETSALDMELRLLTAQMPGAFPVETKGGRKLEYGKARAWLKTMLRGAMLVPRLYLTTVMPVIDWRSDYWARVERNEMTLLDGVALVLAIPTALIGIVALT
ncbi:hypothetical protein CP533_1824 [Ophiocordyceps camponoti-saundersi (nom. inval.)]|nr:hypothetical protein CP533_1824 [Ophiocordyceps camponoti-saundersi (nom. inval.)]